MVKAQDDTINNNEASEKINKVVDPDALFNHFLKSQTCNQTLSTFHKVCQAIGIHYPPSPSSSTYFASDHVTFYPRLKKKLTSWRAKSIWNKLDNRFFGKEYFVNPKLHKSGGQRAGLDMKVLIIGAGPCGLRTAIEMACLGAKVVVLEKRDSFSRNNALHLWPFIITDLKALGAKKLYGKFCAGAIDHISIRQLQLILLKISLMLGVEVLVNVSFEALRPPSSLSEDDQGNLLGWTAVVDPLNHPVSNYEFDVIIGADGKRNTLQGFRRKEFRGKLAIGLTVNFINRNTSAEAKVEEISGVAYIFNQEFFKDLQRETGIDLENIVYYKGETHYFVMTAKKHSLVSKGVLKQDYDDTASLLSYENVDREAMMLYAREAADFSTHHQLPNLDFAINQFGEPDIALFDFTCMYAAENAALFREVNGHKLLSCLVGDSLLEPFWPMGTGCARGFLAAFDTVWLTKQWSMKRTDINTPDNSIELTVLAERESVYRLLHQTTPQSTMKNHSGYTIDPNTRYVNLNTKHVKPHQVKPYYITDRETDSAVMDEEETLPQSESPKREKLKLQQSLTRKVSIVRSSKLLSWCRRMSDGYRDVHIANMTSSWKNGLAICAIIHRFRPDLVNWNDLDPDEVENNNQLAFDIAEKQLGISPVMTGKEMAACDHVDKLLIVTYLSQFYEMFKHETPTGFPPALEDVKSNEEQEEEEAPKSPQAISSTSPVGLLTRFTQHIKRRSNQNKHEDHAKKKKYNFFKKKEGSSVSEPPLSPVQESTDAENRMIFPEPGSETVQIVDTTVKLRQKEDDGKKTGIRQSNRISALSSQLISQWEQNAPQPSPRPSKRKEELRAMSVPSASDKCYFCNRQVYIVERLSAEGFFFHRQCFVCSHCGLTLRRGAYVFVKETGKFFCHENCITASTTCSYKPRTDSAAEAPQTDGEGAFKSLAERIEVGNVRLSMIDHPEELSEEALARHNYSVSMDLDEDENSPADIEYMSDSSDDDIDWESVLRKANEAGQNQLDDDDDSSVWIEDDSLIGSNDFSVADVSSHESLVDKDEKKCENRDTGALQDVEAYVALEAGLSSGGTSLSSIDEEFQRTVGDDEDLLSSSSSSTSISVTAQSKSDEKERRDAVVSSATTKEGKQVEARETNATGARVRESLSSASTMSDEAVKEIVIKSRSASLASESDDDHQTTEEAACDSSKGPPFVEKAEVAPTFPSRKPRTIFNILTSSVAGSKVSQEKSVSKLQCLLETSDQNILSEAKATTASNSTITLRKHDTLDEVQGDLLSTPLDTAEVEVPSKDNNEEHFSSSSVSLSSTTSGEFETTKKDVLDLLEDKTTNFKPLPSLTLAKSLKEQITEDVSKPSETLASAKVRALPRHASIDSILLRTSNSLRNNTSVWSNLDDDSFKDEADVRRIPSGSFNESLMSSYRSTASELVEESPKQPHPPVERKLSHDSLESRMKLRLQARNRWLRQESNFGKSLTRSQSERKAKPQSTVSITPYSKDELSTPPKEVSFKKPGGVIIIETSPSVHSPLTPTAPPASRQQSEVDNDLFFTPRGDAARPSSPTDHVNEAVFSPTSEVLAQSVSLDTTEDFVSAPSTPYEAQIITKRVLPSLPKVPHLEAISPTGSANNTIERKKHKDIEEDFKEREQKVKEKIEKFKAEALKRREYEALRHNDEANTPVASNEWKVVTDSADAGFALDVSGYSPMPSRRKSSLKKKKKAKETTNGKDGQKGKRSLPVPHVDGKPLPGSQVQPHPIPEQSKQKAKKKLLHYEQHEEKRSKGEGSVEIKENNTKSRHFFSKSLRKKQKKKIKSPEPDDVAGCQGVVDGTSTLERKYVSQSDREKAILRGERFRILPLTPSSSKPHRADSCDSLDEEESRKYWARRKRTTLAGLTPAQIDAKITRRVQVAARRQAKLEAQKRLRRAQVIQRQLEEVEVKQKGLEERGVKLEKMLRSDGGDVKEDSKYMQEWFEMVQEKNALLRYENELMIYQRELQLEDVQSRLQQDLRERMALDDKRKTSEELVQEKEILRKMLEVVEQRDELVALLEEQRLKERDESVDPETLLLNKFNIFSDDSSPMSSIQTATTLPLRT